MCAQPIVTKNKLTQVDELDQKGNDTKVVQNRYEPRKIHDACACIPTQKVSGGKHKPERDAKQYIGTE